MLKKYDKANYNADVSASEFISKNISGISSSTVYSHYQSLREKGISTSNIESGRKSILSADSKKLIQKQIKNDDTQTQEEISETLKENNYKGSPKTIREFLKQEGFKSKPQ